MHNKLAMAALFVYVALLLISFIYPHFYGWTFDHQDASSLSAPPGTNGHPFGTDEIGQDLLARMMMGIQRSTYISVIFVLVAGSLGVLVGAISGYFGKWVDNVLMRFVDVILTVPILVAIIVVAANFPAPARRSASRCSSRSSAGWTWPGSCAARSSRCASVSTSRRRTRWAPPTSGSSSST